MALEKQTPLLRSEEAVRPPPTPGRTVLGMPGEEAALRQRCRHGVPPPHGSGSDMSLWG